jgi:Mrp family chromosome partitioning ATPase
MVTQAAVRAEAPSWLGLPAIETTPADVVASPVPGVTRAAADELFRNIYLRAGATTGVVAVTSAAGGEGKTTLALKLASLVARDFPTRRVAYVETDFRRPTIAADLALPANPGLLEWLVRGSATDATAATALRGTPIQNLEVVPAGGPDLNPTRWYCSDALRASIDSLRASHDLVVLDVPAIGSSGGALTLLDAADRILFVVRAGATPAPLVRAALGQLPAGRLGGVVLNGARTWIPEWVRRLVGMP